MGDYCESMLKGNTTAGKLKGNTSAEMLKGNTSGGMLKYLSVSKWQVLD